MQLVTIAECFRFVYILLLRLALTNNLFHNLIAVAFHTGLILHLLIQAYLRLDIISEQIDSFCHLIFNKKL